METQTILIVWGVWIARTHVSQYNIVILQVKYSYCGHNSVSFSQQLYPTPPNKIEDFFCFR